MPVHCGLVVVLTAFSTACCMQACGREDNRVAKVTREQASSVIMEAQNAPKGETECSRKISYRKNLKVWRITRKSLYFEIEMQTCINFSLVAASMLLSRVQ